MNENAHDRSISPIKARLLKTAVAMEREPDADSFLFMHSVLCQTCLPYRDPGSVRRWERSNGKVHLEIEAGRIHDPAVQAMVDVGLPFGPKPRLILAHLNAEALRTGKRELEIGDSLRGFLRRLGLDPKGRNMHAVKDQLTRLATANIRMVFKGSDELDPEQVQGPIVSRFNLWHDSNAWQRHPAPTRVTLNADYFDSLQSHAVPLDERAIAALSNNAMALDAYAWLGQRLHRIAPRSPVRVSWVALHGQFGTGYQHVWKFREVFRRTLDMVRSQYQSADFELTDKGMTLRNSPPPVRGRFTVIG